MPRNGHSTLGTSRASQRVPRSGRSGASAFGIQFAIGIEFRLILRFVLGRNVRIVNASVFNPPKFFSAIQIARLVIRSFILLYVVERTFLAPCSALRGANRGGPMKNDRRWCPRFGESSRRKWDDESVQDRTEQIERCLATLVCTMRTRRGKFDSESRRSPKIRRPTSVRRLELHSKPDTGFVARGGDNNGSWTAVCGGSVAGEVR